MFLGILYVAVFLDAVYTAEYQCPTPFQMLPCKCQAGFLGLGIFCERALLDQVRGPLAEVGKTNQRAYYSMRHVQLPNLPSNLFVGHDVQYINVRECYTTNVDENAFADMAGTLEWLNMTGNPLEHVPSRALQKLSRLKYLILDENAIQVLQAEAFKGLHSLLELSLSSNGIKFIDDSAFVGIGSNFRELDLAKNDLIAVPGQPLSHLSALHYLQLQDNKIASLVPEDFDAMSGESLGALNLANNNIKNVPARVFRSLKKLFSLDLRGNVIDSVHPSAFEGNEDKLLVLKFGHNRLEEIPAASLRNLSRLHRMDLQNNNICKVRKDDFVPHGKLLVYLHLQNNSLKYIDPEAFIGLDVLRELTLQSNQLSAAPFETYSTVLDTLEMFDIHDNPLHCDCNLSWLAHWINGAESRIVQFANETICATPEEHTKKLLAEVPSDHLVCGNSTLNVSEPCCNCVANAQERLCSDYFTTVWQLGFILLTTVLGTSRLF